MASLISWQDVSYSISLKSCRPCSKKSLKILHNISGIFKPGMNAIMGPTGSGKTTLLDILARRIDRRGLDGVVMVDGKKQPKNFNVESGYVVQDDLMMGTLTVRENIEFSANLRLSTSVSRKEKNGKIKSVIEDLGLNKCANSKIGTEFIRGVSGGERKRTAIAMEMIISPSVLFLDEPTTGLDSSTAISVMKMLRRLADKGKTVIFSIHQPRYAIFKLFDTLMLLNAGKTIYHGPADHALDFFNDSGHQCDLHDNPADFFLDVITSKDFKNDVKLKENDEDVTKNQESFTNKKNKDDKNGTLAVEIDNDITENLSTKYLESSYNKKLEKDLLAIKEGDSEMLRNEGAKKFKYKTSFLTQFNYLSLRTLKSSIFNPAAILITAFSSILISVVVGIVFRNVSMDYNEPAKQNRRGAIFFLVVNQMFSSVSTVEIFIKEKNIFVHENSSGYYRVSSYFMAKVLCELIPMRLIPVVILSCISYFMIGFQREAGKFFIFVLSLLVTSLASTSFCIFFSATFSIYSVANLALTLFFILMMLFGGFLANATSIDDWIEWVKYFSVVRYGFNAVSVNEFKDLKLRKNSTYVAGETVLEEWNIDYKTDWDLWENIVALIIMTLIVLFLSYVQLRRIPKHK